MRSARSKNDSPAFSSVMRRAEGVSATSSTLADWVASACEYGWAGSPWSSISQIPVMESKSSRAHSRMGTSRPSRHSSSAGSRPRRATLTWFWSSAPCSESAIGGLSFIRHSATNASRKRSLFWLTPTGSKALTSSALTSTYSTPARRSALVGRSPERATRLGRMKL